MSGVRTFAVCQGCGCWKEIGSDPLPVLADQDMRFFMEQHLMRCPVTGERAVMATVFEDAPDYQPLPEHKRWRPETRAGYHPPQRPTYQRYTTGVRQTLVGIWETNNVGGHSDEALVLLPGGRGVLEYWNSGFAGFEEFCWSLEGQDHLCFSSAPSAPAGKIAGATNYFGTERAYFELLLSTNRHGEKNDMLCVYPNGMEEEPFEFFRSRRPLKDYTLPKEC